jgi:hypothetical protein
MRLKAVTIALLSALLASAVALTLGVPAAHSSSESGAQKYGVINATVNAATDHEIAGSSAFPNYTTGAVDNYYTLAHSAVDNSPSAEGTASPADTGPIGQTAAAGNFSQPQYADARWPGNGGKATYGNKGGPYAVANAGPYTATAACSEASNGTTSSSGSLKIATPKGFSKHLSRALAAWKAKWLPRLHLKLPGLGLPKLKSPVKAVNFTALTVPTVTTPSVKTPTVSTPTVSTPSLTTPATKKSHARTHARAHKAQGKPAPPDGQALLQSTTAAGVDPSSGAIVTNGESSLGTVSLGSGQIVLQGIDVTVQVTNNGSPTQQVAVKVANASVGGVPVTIDQDGVSVQGQKQGLPYAQADDALNSALKQAGVQIFTVSPEIQKTANEVTITATGVHVAFTQPVAPSGVPAQFVEHIFGEVFVDSLAVPGTPLPKLSGLGLSSSGTGGSSGFSGGGSAGVPSSGSSGYSSSQPGTSSAPTSGTASQTGSSFFTSLASKPLWLLLTYFLWQALVVGTGASLWFWRMQGAT